MKIPKGQSESYIEEERTAQSPKEKVQKDKKWSTKHTHKTKDRETRTPLKTRGQDYNDGVGGWHFDLDGRYHLLDELIISDVDNSLSKYK